LKPLVPDPIRSTLCMDRPLSQFGSVSAAIGRPLALCVHYACCPFDAGRASGKEIDPPKVCTGHNIFFTSLRGRVLNSICPADKDEKGLARCCSRMQHLTCSFFVPLPIRRKCQASYQLFQTFCFAAALLLLSSPQLSLLDSK